MSENMIYSAIKGGIISNTKQLAVHYGKWGIELCICPGGVEGHIKNKKIKQSRLFVKIILKELRQSPCKKRK